MSAVEYVARFIRGAAVVLLHIIGMPPELVEHRGGEADAKERRPEHEVRGQSQRLIRRIRRRTDREIFGPARQLLLSYGGNDWGLETRLVIEASGVPALAIVAETAQRPYDAVVISCRSRMRHPLVGGTAAMVVSDVHTTAVWLVPSSAATQPHLRSPTAFDAGRQTLGLRFAG